MIKIEVKGTSCNTERQGTFTEVMTELTLSVACMLKNIAKEANMPLGVVRESFMAAFVMASGKEDEYDIKGKASEGASGIGH
ncbi:MAG: hypothetical protein IKU60_03825 [Clostridia bacterium]|nr:hypothetical protein [Clostridia bacterium]